MIRTETIRITPELLALVVEIDGFKGAWRGLGPLPPERLEALRNIATIKSIGSSTRLEGSKLTDRDVARLLSGHKTATLSSRDEQEVAGCAEVMDTTIHAWQHIPDTEIDEFKGAWHGLGALPPERLKALRDIATIESIGSSTRIEGSKMTDRDVARLLSNLETAKLSSRDEQEVAGCAEVMDTIIHAWQHIPVTENHIKQLHRDLLKFSVKDERHRGEYKYLRNDVAAFDHEGNMIGVVFETATPFDTPRLMEELVAWLKEAQELNRLHPLLVIAVFIVVFLQIHPFQDGNGRLSRILTTLLLLQAGYAHVPYSSLDNAIENSKEAYYLALRQTQSTIHSDAPDWQPWLTFFLRALQQQKRRLETKVERERRGALAELPELAIKILDYVQDHGRITNRDMVREEGASPNTLKALFGSLVKKGLLVRNGAGRSTWYSLPMGDDDNGGST